MKGQGPGTEVERGQGPKRDGAIGPGLETEDVIGQDPKRESATGQGPETGVERGRTQGKGAVRGQSPERGRKKRGRNWRNHVTSLQWCHPSGKGHQTVQPKRKKI